MSICICIKPINDYKNNHPYTYWIDENPDSYAEEFDIVIHLKGGQDWFRKESFEKHFRRFS